MTESNKPDIQAAIEAGELIGQKFDGPDGKQYAVVPNNARVVDLQDALNADLTSCAGVLLDDVASFCAYFNRFAIDDSMIFADQDEAQIIGMIDYHGPDAPRAAMHNMRYQSPVSLEWQRWTEIDGQRISQTDFATFIEENLGDIVKPDAATILEVAQELKSKKNVDFASSVRLHDGQNHFTYNETIENATTKGEIDVPAEFEIGIPVFKNGQPYKIRCFLRYRVNEGRLGFRVDMHRREFIYQKAFADVVEEVAKGCGREVLMGSAGMVHRQRGFVTGQGHPHGVLRGGEMD